MAGKARRVPAADGWSRDNSTASQRDIYLLPGAFVLRCCRLLCSDSGLPMAEAAKLVLEHVFVMCPKQHKIAQIPWFLL